MFRIAGFADLLEASPEQARAMRSFVAGGPNDRPMGNLAFLAALGQKPKSRSIAARAGRI